MLCRDCFKLGRRQTRVPLRWRSCWRLNYSGRKKEAVKWEPILFGWRKFLRLHWVWSRKRFFFLKPGSKLINISHTATFIWIVEHAMHLILDFMWLWLSGYAPHCTIKLYIILPKSRDEDKMWISEQMFTMEPEIGCQKLYDICSSSDPLQYSDNVSAVCLCVSVKNRKYDMKEGSWHIVSFRHWYKLDKLEYIKYLYSL